MEDTVESWCAQTSHAKGLTLEGGSYTLGGWHPQAAIQWGLPQPSADDSSQGTIDVGVSVSSKNSLKEHFRRTGTSICQKKPTKREALAAKIRNTLHRQGSAATAPATTSAQDSAVPNTCDGDGDGKSRDLLESELGWACERVRGPVPGWVSWPAIDTAMRETVGRTAAEMLTPLSRRGSSGSSRGGNSVAAGSGYGFEADNEAVEKMARICYEGGHDTVTLRLKNGDATAA